MIKYLSYSILFFLIIFCILFTKKIGEGEIKYTNIFKSSSVSILNFGDVMFDRGVRNIIVNRKRDPFEYIKRDIEDLKGFDVVIANLEGPIVVMDRNLCQQKAYNFQFSPDTTDRLKSIDITMVNIANNHSYDCYKVGYESTKNYLTKAGIDYMGDKDLSKSYVVKTINGKKVAFIGMDETVQPVPISSFYSIVKKLSDENDYVVVDIHWGTEYMLSENANQIAIAHKLIDNGASIIFGHHPHVIEPVKIYKGKAIFYSLGNFVFDQDFGDTTTGIGASVEFKNNGVAEFKVFPFKLRSFAPELLKTSDKDKFCDKFLINLKHDGCMFEI